MTPIDRLGPDSRYRRWKRGPAIAILLALAAALVVACWPATTTPQPKVRASQAEQSDLDLYRDIIGRVRGGEAYYPVAADELRTGGYPLKPFITFRLPTQAYAYATLGEPVMIGLQLLLALAVILVWYRRLREQPLWLRAIATFMLAAGLGGLVEPVTGLFHESWAALLLALTVGLRRPGHAAWAIVAGAAALMIRETALPMVLAMGALALVERRWREAIGWASAVGVFALYLAWHAGQVASVIRPEDLASPGWDGLLGFHFALKALGAVTAATVLPGALASAALVLSVFGWASVRSGAALRAAILILGYGAMLALFARRDTFYWALMAAPLSLVGLAFVPAALRDLAGALDLPARRVAGARS